MAYPIYQGMDLKFQVTTEWPDFQLTEDPFEIIVKDRYGRIVRDMKKDDLFWDSDGRYYFTLENVRRGIYYAYFKGDYEDDDYDKQRAVVTDYQKLLEVPSCVRDCPCENSNFTSSYKCCHKVHYQMVFTVSIDGDDYLCGSDGKYILTSDGKRICFKSDKRKQIEDMGKVILDTMTGEEFKQFIEGYNPNGQIDTVSEMIRAAQGISDDETIQQDVQEQIGDNQADNSDIDEIFGGASTAPTVPTQPITAEEEEEP